MSRQVAVPVETYRAFIEEKRRRLIALCDAAKDYFCLEMDQEIEELSKPAKEPDMRMFGPYGPRNPTVEDLAKAQEQVQHLESQLEKLSDMPTDGPVGEFLGPLVEGMYRPMIEQQATSAREFRDRIQKRMEEQAAAKETGS